jgi:hypothetical protein
MRASRRGGRWFRRGAAATLWATVLLGAGVASAGAGVGVGVGATRPAVPSVRQAHVITQGSPAAVAPPDPTVSIPAPTDTSGGGGLASPPVQVQIQVTPTSASAPLPARFLGFSVEYSAIPAYLGRDPRAIDPVFTQLLTGVDQGHSPILRIGGNSTDNSWLPLPGVIPPLAVTYSLTDDWLATVQALAEATNARLVLGVNLAADDPQIAGAEARALVQGVGRHSIDALEVGNEPDLYRINPWYDLPDSSGGETAVYRRDGDYPVNDFLTDLNHWRAILPGLPLAAGALAALRWLPNVDAVAGADADVSTVTVHRYPLSACTTSPTNPSFPSMANLLSPAATEGLAAPIAPFANAIHAEHRTIRVDELNSASCEGEPGVSNTFGSALWMLNELFDMAAAGVDGVNVHTLPGATYAPFSFTETDGHWSGEVHPLYYGMLLFASAFPVGAHLLNVTDSSSADGGDVKAYSTVTANGQVRTTILNEDASADAEVQLTLPSSGDLTEETLTAPSLDATGGISLGGQSFGDPTSTGTLTAPSTSTISSINGSYDVPVPAASAVLLTSG